MLWKYNTAVNLIKNQSTETDRLNYFPCKGMTSSGLIVDEKLSVKTQKSTFFLLKIFILMHKFELQTQARLRESEQELRLVYFQKIFDICSL